MPDMVATSHIGNVASMTKELNFSFYLVLFNLNIHMWLWLPHWTALSKSLIQTFTEHFVQGTLRT